MSFEATITPDPSGQFARLAARYGGTLVYEAIGASVAEVVRDHLAGKNRIPNKNNFPKSGFYEGVAKGTREEVDASGVSVVLPYPYRAKIIGPTVVRPVNGSTYLTIPMVAAAYGRRAREFSNLEFAMVPGVGPALVFEGAEDTPVFRLVRKVTLNPDPEALPDDESIVAAVKRALDEIDV